MSTAPSRGRQFVDAVTVVVRVDGDTGCDEFIDAVQNFGRQSDVGGRQVRRELFHGPWTHDGGRDSRVIDHERDGGFDQRQSRLLGELGEFLDDVEFSLVRGGAQIETGTGSSGGGRELSAPCASVRRATRRRGDGR